jgi:hypothetical protein
MLLRPIISRLFTCSNVEKRVLALVVSLWSVCTILALSTLDNMTSIELVFVVSGCLIIKLCQ